MLFKSEQAQMASMEAQATGAEFMDLTVMKLHAHGISLPDVPCMWLSRLRAGAIIRSNTDIILTQMPIMHEKEESMLK